MCTQTPVTAIEWKFVIHRLDGIDPLELLYSDNHLALAQQGFNLYTEDSNLYNTTSNSMQNFSITIVCVLADMTGIEIVCGASAEGIDPGKHQKFHNRGSLLVIHKSESSLTSVTVIRSGKCISMLEMLHCHEFLLHGLYYNR